MKGGKRGKREENRKRRNWSAGSGSDRKLSKPFLGKKCDIFPPQGERGKKKGKIFMGKIIIPPPASENFSKFPRAA